MMYVQLVFPFYIVGNGELTGEAISLKATVLISGEAEI